MSSEQLKMLLSYWKWPRICFSMLKNKVIIIIIHVWIRKSIACMFLPYNLPIASSHTELFQSRPYWEVKTVLFYVFFCLYVKRKIPVISLHTFILLLSLSIQCLIKCQSFWHRSITLSETLNTFIHFISCHSIILLVCV